MNIPDEAVEAMQKAEEETDPAWAIYWTQRSRALSQIALVEAQEAANEQAKIANLIALASIPLQNGYENETYDARNAALFEGLLEFSMTSDDDERCSLRPNIACTLGIPTGRRTADHE